MIFAGSSFSLFLSLSPSLHLACCRFLSPSLSLFLDTINQRTLRSFSRTRVLARSLCPFLSHSLVCLCSLSPSDSFTSSLFLLVKVVLVVSIKIDFSDTLHMIVNSCRPLLAISPSVNATHGSTLQRTTLQQTTTHCNSRQHTAVLVFWTQSPIASKRSGDGCVCVCVCLCVCVSLLV